MGREKMRGKAVSRGTTPRTPCAQHSPEGSKATVKDFLIQLQIPLQTQEGFVLVRRGHR